MKERLLKVLTVDWDYFFPSMSEFDWGFNENRRIGLELLWGLRPFTVGLISKKEALKECMPQGYEDFWQRVAEPKLRFPIIVVESHAFFVTVVERFFPSILSVVNFDAHHDAGYATFTKKRLNLVTGDVRTSSGEGDDLHCGNWAGLEMMRGRIKEYECVYPAWREKEPEDLNCCLGKFKRSFSFEKRKFDALVICRSGHFTPTWADDKWIDFLFDAAVHFGFMDRVSLTKKRRAKEKLSLLRLCRKEEMQIWETAGKLRSPTFEEAEDLVIQYKAQLRKAGYRGSL